LPNPGNVMACDWLGADLSWPIRDGQHRWYAVDSTAVSTVIVRCACEGVVIGDGTGLRDTQ
jgi:hypothetical protein